MRALIRNSNSRFQIILACLWMSLSLPVQPIYADSVTTNINSSMYNQSKKIVNPISFSTEDGVVYADIKATIDEQYMSRILEEGTSLHFIWSIGIDQQQSYWFDSTVGSIELVRQVKPDLVSRTWNLIDQSNEIHSQSTSIASALKFLSVIHHFPLIDQSLLTSGESYQVKARLYVVEGELTHEWWKEMFRLGKTVAEGTFNAQ